MITQSKVEVFSEIRGQLAENPGCSQCGCVTVVGMQEGDLYRLPGGFPVRKIFQVSDWVGPLLRKTQLRLSFHISQSTAFDRTMGIALARMDFFQQITSEFLDYSSGRSGFSSVS